MADHVSQADDRLVMNGWDRWGRLYVYSIEKKTGDVTGQITPAFEDPLALDQKYLTIRKDRPYTVFIDYEAAILDLKRAEKEWKVRLFNVCRSTPGADAKNPSEEVLSLTGPQPLDWKSVEAARKGNWKFLTPDGKALKKRAQPPGFAPEDAGASDEDEDSEGVAVGSRARGGTPPRTG